MTTTHRGIDRETLEQLLDAGADLTQALRDLAGDYGLEATFEELLEDWERAYAAAERQLTAPIEEVAP